MRKFVILAAIVSMTFVWTGNVEAGKRNRRYQRTRTRTTYRTQNSGGGFFSRLMELERRKNAFLFGR